MNVLTFQRLSSNIQMKCYLTYFPKNDNSLPINELEISNVLRHNGIAR